MDLFNLQLMAEETGVEPVDAAQETGVEPADAGQTGDGTPDRDAEFRAMVEGDYADAYHSYTEGMVQGRVKNLKTRLASYDPLMSALANRYGLDANDVNGIVDAVNNDKAYIREQANANGVTEEVQLQLNELKAERARRESDSVRQQIAQSVEETQRDFPDFDLETEMQNPDFMAVFRQGGNVKKAYMYAHMDELMSGAMQHTAKVVREKTINDIRARGLRPDENGTGSHASAVTTADISKLSREKINELIERAKSGEKITPDKMI